MSLRLRRPAALAILALGLASLAQLTSSCTAGTLPPKGQLMLTVTTNMAPTKDFDAIHVLVIEDGSTAPILDLDYALEGSQPVKLPATLGIVAGNDPNKIVRITVEGRRAGNVRIRRQAVTRVPTNRVALLQLPVDGLCIDNTCPPDPNGEPQTCIVGSCQTANVDPASLPDYSKEAVFGRDGACFDTLGCFSAGKLTELRASDCSIDKAPGAGINVAVVRPPGTDGICGSNACLLPLDRDPFGGPAITGWREEGTRILVPKAVCERSLPVMLTTACPTKNGPTCGPWSAVGSGSGLAADASIPLGDASLGDGSMGDASTSGAPSSLKFVDEDPTKEVVAGTVLVGRAADESRLTGYELYWGDGPSTRLGLIAKLQKTGNNLSYPLSGPVFPGATHLLAFGATSAGPGLGISTSPIDNYPRTVNLTVNNAEISETITLMDPAGETLMAVGVDVAQTPRRDYPALLRCKLDGSGCTYASLGAVGSGTSARLGATLDSINRKLLVVSDRSADGSADGFSLNRCNLDGTGCVASNLPTTPGFLSSEACPIPLVVDPMAGDFYSVRGSSSGSYLYRCPLVGPCSSPPTLIGPGVGGCASIQLRRAEGKILVVRLAGNVSPSLVRCNLDGSSCSSDALGTSVMGDVVTAVDEVNKKLLVVGHDINDAKLTLVRCNLDGTGCATNQLTTPDTSAPTHPFLLVDGVHARLFAFATSASRAVYYRCHLDGTSCAMTVTIPYAPSFGGNHPSALLHDGKLLAVTSTGLAPPVLQLSSLTAY